VSPRQFLGWAESKAKTICASINRRGSGAGGCEAVLVGDPAFNASPAARAAALKDRPQRLAGQTGTGDVGLTFLSGAEPGQATPPQGVWRSLEKVPATGRLVRTLGGKLRNQGFEVHVWTDALASETSLAQMRSPAILLLASHGHFLDDSPMLSFKFQRVVGDSERLEIHGLDYRALLEQNNPMLFSMIALAGASTDPKEVFKQLVQGVQTYSDDGLLTGYEAAALDLRSTELVVLAGCQTGVGGAAWYETEKPRFGEIKVGLTTGDMVVGLRQGFHVAGAQSVIMSLWPVPEKEATTLVQQFFQNWLVDGMSKYMAFRSSQLSNLKQARLHREQGHPLWWAGFIYEGNPGAPVQQSK